MKNMANKIINVLIVDDEQIEKITATHYKIKSKRGEKPQGYTRIQIEVME